MRIRKVGKTLHLTFNAFLVLGNISINDIEKICHKAKEAHVVNTWNSYIKITEEGNLLIPIGRMNTTEDNLKEATKS
ncbi:MAG TPA: hypothetical protein PKG58_03105 [Bacillota bacterium]|nr:hypothetical protein [Bacillota bacterium]